MEMNSGKKSPRNPSPGKMSQPSALAGPSFKTTEVVLYIKMPPMDWKMSWNTKISFSMENISKKLSTLPTKCTIGIINATC